jgi:hypothetical protein
MSFLSLKKSFKKNEKQGLKFGQGKSTLKLVPAGEKEKEKKVDDLQKSHPFPSCFSM